MKNYRDDMLLDKGIAQAVSNAYIKGLEHIGTVHALSSSQDNDDIKEAKRELARAQGCVYAIRNATEKSYEALAKDLEAKIQFASSNILSSPPGMASGSGGQNTLWKK
jgi:hypothetical protein